MRIATADLCNSSQSQLTKEVLSKFVVAIVAYVFAYQWNKFVFIIARIGPIFVSSTAVHIYDFLYIYSHLLMYL